ncbi:SUF system Fe-S cluster assembly protein [Eilatimonas milleporae]|uniref:FeS assembly SUF system protein n=1 Tax=Eilatimonas milleporae TaxID=911205 RepID=A0A3M0CC25_9PROT|nr:SUF system Fe-S cluster assembly protein [Eilatimonas milleporae]RMB00583.1 FeS assembly SUF system protein [Eilatimonas milleporae]
MTDGTEKRDIITPGTDTQTSSYQSDTPLHASPAKPARPVVSDAEEGTYFLNKFLDGADEEPQDTHDAAPPTTTNTGDDIRHQPQPATASSGDLEADVIAALREIYDPEIPVNIYELGLVYEVDVDDAARVTVTMTLTTPHCPVAESMPGEVELKVCSVPGVNGAEVNLVWDPPWDMNRMSDEARLELGML